MFTYPIERTRAALYGLFAAAVAQAGRVGLGRRLPFLRRMYFAISALLRPGVTTVGPWTVYFHRADNAVSHALRNQSTYEPFELDLIAHLIQPGSCVVDVGANIGLHTLVMSTKCGPTGRVLGLEPDPDNARLWRRNVKANGCRNVELLQIAASDRTEELTLYLNDENRGDHRVYDPGGDRSSVLVTAHRLDGLLLARGLRPMLLKVDVQGWEPKVLAGTLPILKGTYPFALVTEFWTEGLVAAGFSALAYLELIDELHLDLYEIEEQGRCLTPVPPDRVTLLATSRDTNLLGVRGIEIGLLPGAPQVAAGVDSSDGVGLRGA